MHNYVWGFFMDNKKKIIVFGSAFNPPHFGHAALLRVALKNFACDEVWVMPSGDRLDKNFEVSAENRFQMAKIWIEELFQDSKVPVILSRMEADRGKPTVTHDTHQELSRLYPDSEFYFLFGGDILSEVREKWHKGDDLYQNLNFIIVGRPGHALPPDLPRQSVILEDSGSGISSTKIRAAIKEGREIKDLLPAAVAGYIQEKGLYRPK